MGKLDDFARDKSGPQLNMLAAIALLFVSQFFLYFNDGSYADLRGTSDYTSGTVLDIYQFQNIVTGWQAHPQIWFVLPALLLCFLYQPIVHSAGFRKSGYWIGVVLVFAGFVPGAPFRDALGAQMGGVAVLLALVAAIRNQVESKKASSPAG